MGNLGSSRWLKKQKCFRCLGGFSAPGELVQYHSSEHGHFCIHKKKSCFEPGTNMAIQDLRNARYFLREHNYVNGHEMGYRVLNDLSWLVWYTKPNGARKIEKEILNICRDIVNTRHMVYVTPTKDSTAGWFESTRDPIIAQYLTGSRERKSLVQNMDMWLARVNSIDGRSQFMREQDLITYVLHTRIVLGSMQV